MITLLVIVGVAVQVELRVEDLDRISTAQRLQIVSLNILDSSSSDLRLCWRLALVQEATKSKD